MSLRRIPMDRAAAQAAGFWTKKRLGQHLLRDPTVVEATLAALAAGKDEAIILTPPIPLTLEYAVEFIADDELVEVTPQSIRIRKRFLKEHERKRAARGPADILVAS